MRFIVSTCVIFAVGCASGGPSLTLGAGRSADGARATADKGAATGAVVHARVWTGDAKHPWAEAVAWRGDRIVAVGTDAEIAARLAPGVTAIDARGGMAVPGFIDSHLHFVEGGAMLASVQLHEARSKADLAAALAAFVRGVPHGAWIIGGRWDNTNWGGELPDKTWIDAVSPDNPVWVDRVDGHMALANSAALRAAGITKDTKDVAGGTIARNAAGEPTGIFEDNALDLVARAIPARTPDQDDKALDAAMAYVAANGVTSVTSMGTWEDVATYRRAEARGALHTRVYAVVPLATWERLRDEVTAHGRGDDWVRIGGLKGFADGSLGAHTALMLGPFSDARGGTGLVVTPEEDLYARAAGADAAGLQVMIHAIGDGANRAVLDVYERVAKEHGPRDRRYRVEHAQHLAPEDVPRFGALGVAASMQPYHCIDDGRWAESVIGAERAKTSYAFRALLDTHATLAFGSDWPVAPATPLEGIYAAVTRRTLDGAHPGGWVPEQKITVEEALRAYTWGGAYASFTENDKGTLEPGKLADVTVVDRDLTAARPESLAEAKVVATVVGGRVVYSK
jgi:predicted amidohydrolase YtcJ